MTARVVVRDQGRLAALNCEACHGNRLTQNSSLCDPPTIAISRGGHVSVSYKFVKSSATKGVLSVGVVLKKTRI